MASNRAFRPRALTPFRAGALAVVLAVATIGFGQFDYGGGRSGAEWEAFPLNPKKRVQLDWRNANVDAIVAYFQNISGVTIVKDPSLTGALSLSTAKPVPLKDAFAALNAILRLKGYKLQKDGNLLVIQKLDQGRGNGSPAQISQDPPTGGDQSVLKVYPIAFANASQIARVVNSVFADSGNSNFGGFGGRGFGEIGGNTVDLDPAIQGFGGQGNRGGRGGFGGQGGQGGPAPQNGRGGFNFNRGGQATTLVHADYDDYSNTVIVSAPYRFQSQVLDLVKQLDKLTDNPVATKTYVLKYASATDAATVVQNVLSANVPRGKGGATTGQQAGANGFFSALRGQTAGAGTATADPRTNALVVTATPDNIKIVDEVVKNLDSNVPAESTTFVIPLNNAKADDVATLLKNAFGTRTGLNNTSTTGTTTTRNSTSTLSTNGNRSTTNNTQRTQLAGSDVEYAMQDPNAQSGELLTSVGVTQGFGQNFLGGGQNRGSSSSTSGISPVLGLTPNGQVVNTRDLTNQVTAIADTNTNSLIVVTAPQNAEIIRRVIDQLDKIPEQVLIETVIVEASLTAEDKLGVTFNSSTDSGNTSSTVGGVFSNVGATTTTTNTENEGFQYALTGKNYSIFLNALKEDEKFNVLATPKIFTSNNLEAEINISQSIPYITNSITDVNGNISYQYAFENVGVVLDVTPRITSNGFVSMVVTQTANDLQGYTSFNAPIVNQRTADTTVSVKDGNTVILGGIIRKDLTIDSRKIPLLGDIPVLGQLFRSNVKTNVKTELIVFLTPHIVRSAEDSDRLQREIRQKLSPETQKNIDDFLRRGNNDGGQRDKKGAPTTGLSSGIDKDKKPSSTTTPPPSTTPPTNPPPTNPGS